MYDEDYLDNFSSQGMSYEESMGMLTDMDEEAYCDDVPYYDGEY